MNTPASSTSERILTAIVGIIIVTLVLAKIMTDDDSKKEITRIDQAISSRSEKVEQSKIETKKVLEDFRDTVKVTEIRYVNAIAKIDGTMSIKDTSARKLELAKLFDETMEK